MQVICYSLRPAEMALVPKDARIAVAQRYRTVDVKVYGARLHACDVLAFPIDDQSNLLTSGVLSDALSVGIGGLIRLKGSLF